MKIFQLLILLLFALSSFTQNKAVQIEPSFRIKKLFPEGKYKAYKTDKYLFPENNTVVFKTDFGSEKIKNSRAWNKEDFTKGVYEIDLVFTLYPSNEKQWYEDFFDLTKNRVAELLEIDDRFILDTLIKWNIYLQTFAKNKSDAKKQFHGFVIKYKNLDSELSVSYYKNRLDELRKYDKVFTANGQKLEKTFLRNSEKWKNMLIITDCTYSMMPYSTHVVLWHLLNNNPHNIVTYTFFNDGDSRPISRKKIGKTGGVYVVENPKKERILNIMRMVRIAGYGNDDEEENDLEAILKTMKVAKNYDDVILLADANSSVRDMELLKELNRPIRIVLCGFNSQTLNLLSFWQYYEIAQYTGGSIHTVESDIENLAAMTEDSKFIIDGIEVTVKNGKVVLAKN